MTMSIEISRAGRLLLIALPLLATGACGGRHHLADYDFAGRSLAVVRFSPPSPELYTGNHGVSSDNAIVAAIEAGSAVAVNLEGRRARARLDSAAVRVDIADLLADRTAERVARYLGAHPVEREDGADFLLEVDVERFGIDASGGSASLFVQGEAILIDARSGREIWSEEVSAWDRLTPSYSGPGGTTTGTIITAATLGQISVDEYARVLEQLADYAADVITRELREDLRDVRDDRRN